ncbi:complement C1q-like protein 2 [Mercenaria mercenaria]|uniref:complement C1q-like protein 2 n=1 Tax=Mercenaria mercenaria TaxID=6596 RepID=UPI00234E375B|nr:complement C1q-like protein 2 [Mercenaria mercenaria]
MKSFPSHVFCCVFFAVAVSAIDLRKAGVPYRRQTDNFVAFSVGLDSNVNLAQNATVKYNVIWTNKGNGYDSSTGVFTCPQAGLYTFIYHGISETAGTMNLDVYKNDQYQIGTYAHNANDYASASNSITLSLQNGDRVYIKGHGTSVLYGRADEVYSTFSGFLLVPHGDR